MSKLQHHQYQRTSKNHRKDRFTGKSELIKGSIVATLIAATPFLYYLHESVPHTKVWDTFLFTFESNFYENANQAMWLITTKLIPLFLLFIWFFTCRHWWYHVIIVPIAMYVFQLAGFFNIEVRMIDAFPFIYLVPLMAIIIPSIYLIRAQMFSRITDAEKSLEELEEEFKIKPKSFMDKISEYF